MKANEFVKNHGWEYAKGIVIACESGFLPKNQNYDDLKRLVESHELVSKATPEELYQAEICEGIWCNHRLAQAILDVESCQ